MNTPSFEMMSVVEGANTKERCGGNNNTEKDERQNTHPRRIQANSQRNENQWNACQNMYKSGSGEGSWYDNETEHSGQYHQCE
jgi:hypothetical protein